MNAVVKAVNVLKTLSPEQFALVVTLARPENPRRKKPGPKPGSRRKPRATPAPPPPKRSRRIEPGEPESE